MEFYFLYKVDKHVSMASFQLLAQEITNQWTKDHLYTSEVGIYAHPNSDNE